jgi:hypothetical protein
MQIGKPPHSKYILANVDETTYKQYVLLYAKSKQFGVKGIYFFLSGSGLYTFLQQSAKGIIFYQGKRRLSIALITVSTYVCAPAVASLTNATRVIKCCQLVYTSVGYVMESFEDASTATFLPLDFIIFGQPIPSNLAGRYSSWSNITDLIKELPIIGD